MGVYDDLLLNFLYDVIGLGPCEVLVAFPCEIAREAQHRQHDHGEVEDAAGP